MGLSLLHCRGSLVFHIVCDEIFSLWTSGPCKPGRHLNGLDAWGYVDLPEAQQHSSAQADMAQIPTRLAWWLMARATVHQGCLQLSTISVFDMNMSIEYT